MHIHISRYKYIIPFLVAMLGLTVSEAYGQRVYANDQQTSVNALPLLGLAEVSNSGFAIDSDLTNFSTLKIGLGLGNTATQNLQFSGTLVPEPGSPVTLKFTGNQSVLSLLNNISVQRTQGGVGNGINPSYNGSALLDLLGLFSSSDSSEFIIPPTGVNFDGVQLKVGGLVALSMTAQYYYAFFIASPKINDITLCAGVPVTFIANNTGDPGIDYKIYADTTGSAAIATLTGHQFTLGTLPVGTHTYYARAIDLATAGKQYYSAWKTITVTVEAVPDPPLMDIN